MTTNEKRYRCGVLTISDKGAAGERQDTSGPALQKILAAANFEVAAALIIPDQKDRIRETLLRWCDDLQLDLVITTGGTGLSPRDVTPETTSAILDREIPGISEAMRMSSMKITPHAMLSRGISGIRGKSIVINLPGSEKAARENIETVLPALHHAIYKLQGGTKDCGTAD